MVPKKKEKQKEYSNKTHQGSSVEESYVAWDLSMAAANIRRGPAAGILQTIQNRLKISKAELSQLLTISPRTLDRRKKEGVLPADESERSYRIARLTDLAADVVGNMEKASKWFKEPNYALGNQKPIELMETEPGARLLERTLHQIEHGIIV